VPSRFTDETYALPPVSISRKEAFSFGLARKLLVHYEGTPLHLDMKAVLDKIAESLEGEVTLKPDPSPPSATPWHAG
jgi:predicted DNA-binding transcriptional regulator YafY